MLDCWQKLRKIVGMIHEITSICFLVFSLATLISAVIATKPRCDDFALVAVGTFALAIVSTVGAFFTL